MQKLYSAPMEGVTCLVWRRAHRRVFGGVDYYMAPFIEPNQNMKLSGKDKRELLSEREENLIPQVLTGRSDYFILAARELMDYGFGEINLNLGCPSGTVTAKHKGSGALLDTAALDNMLCEIFSSLPGADISVKTRAGFFSFDEWDAIFEIYKKYPLKSLILHPRTREMMYKGRADREIFIRARDNAPFPLIYNGDIVSEEDKAFSWDCDLMAGRGLASDPALFRRAKGGDKACKEELSEFSSLIYEGYREYMSGDKPTIMRMKELWRFLSPRFAGYEKPLKAITKAKTTDEYKTAVKSLFALPLK
ncbi:MAG: tRNA-dihydrouridine synthase family protein [Oscillospiraceae bacterium]|nr:tRNA-dihydrouridine synthase family protein [Oscillospiraceae bacterium]